MCCGIWFFYYLKTMKKTILIVLSFICIGWGVVQNPLPPSKNTKSWCWHAKGGFKVPCSYNYAETFVDEVPASVEAFSKDDIQLCYWPLLGTWSTFGEFPEEGVWLSPTERVKNVTYRADFKGIASGYTQNGNIYYLKQKIIFGGEVKHSKVLVLIHSQSKKNTATILKLTNIVKDW